MNPTCKNKREGLEAVLEYQSRQEGLSQKEAVDERLTQLQTFVGQLESTPSGRVELQRRLQRFGACVRREGESAVEFYGRLRYWLDRSL